MLQRSPAELPRCAVSYMSEDGVDKTLVLASAFALAPHQRRPRLPRCIITMPSGQRERACCNLKRKLSFVEFYPKQTKKVGGEEEKGVSGRALRQGQLIERWKKYDFLSWQPVNRLMEVRFAMSWYLSGWAERGREAETHKMTFWWISNCPFSPWPHFAAHLFIYLPHFLTL